MYISNDNGVSNLYANAESATYAFRDIAFPETTNDFQLSFFWKNEGESDSWESVRVYIGEPENITGGQGDYEGAELANATLLGSFYGNGDYWSIENLLLENEEFAGQTKRLYFFFYSDGYLCNNPPAAIDDISIIELNCGAIDDIEISNITTNSVDINITADDAADFILYYKTEYEDTWNKIPKYSRSS